MHVDYCNQTQNKGHESYHCDNLPNLVKKQKPKIPPPLTELALKACFFDPFSPPRPPASSRNGGVLSRPYSLELRDSLAFSDQFPASPMAVFRYSIAHPPCASSPPSS